MSPRFLARRPLWLIAGVVASVLLAGAVAADHAPFRLQPAPDGHDLTSDEIKELASRFTQNPLRGGQTPPRLYAAVNDEVSIFLQFDNANPERATKLRYVGISVKGVFCEEARPDPAFTHFHSFRPVPNYAEGHGGQPGEEGYWLMWVAADDLELQGRAVAPGIDYEFSPTPPPSCGDQVPAPSFDVPGGHRMTHDEIMALALLFEDNPLNGGQTAPRLYRWVNENTLIFLQFDRANPEEATQLRYVGIGRKGTFCEDGRPSADFSHFHSDRAVPTYAQGHGGEPGEHGIWLLWVATDSFTAGGREIAPGPDREFSPTPPPACHGEGE